MMDCDSYEAEALEAQALHDMEFMEKIDSSGDGQGYTYREPKAEPYRLATASQLDWLRGLLPAIEGVRTLLKGGCGEQSAAALSFALGRIRDELEDGIDEIDKQRAK